MDDLVDPTLDEYEDFDDFDVYENFDDTGIENEESNESANTEVSGVEEAFKFDPPVYLQRYRKVYEIVTDPKWEKHIETLSDFGCAEFTFFNYVKRALNLKQINLIDIDEDLLEENILRVQPLPAEWLHRRKDLLTVTVFAGSVCQPDRRLLKTDVVTAIELIEHLFSDELEGFTYNIFNYISPKMIIITTPNSDFNVVFGDNMKGKFRHYDHKFEWSRNQFEDWAKNVTLRFPSYDVSFFGIGEASNFDVGQCSQMALFVRKDLINNNVDLPERCLENESFGICTYCSYSQSKNTIRTPDGEQVDMPYKIIKEICYPVDDDCRTEEQKMLDEIRYRINFCIMFRRDEVEVDFGQYHIPLKLIRCENKIVLSDDELDKLLTKNGFTVKSSELEDTGPYVIIIQEDEEEKETDMDEISNDDPVELNNEPVNDEENWDNENDIHPEVANYRKVVQSTTGSINEPGTSSKSSEKLKFPNNNIFKSLSQVNTQLSSAATMEIKVSENKENTCENNNKTETKITSLDTRNMKLGYNNRGNEIKPLDKTKFLHLKNTRYIKEPTAGPSNVKKPNIEDEVLEDMESLATILLKNAINKLNIPDEIKRQDDIIEFNSYTEQSPSIPTSSLVPVSNLEQTQLKQNCDEGTSEETAKQNFLKGPRTSTSSKSSSSSKTSSNLVARASTEALIDPSSEKDSLSDFEISSVSDFELPDDVRLLEARDQAVLPDWLLQVALNEDLPEWFVHLLRNPAEIESLVDDDPHNFCRGDGIGLREKILSLPTSVQNLIILLGIHPSMSDINEDTSSGSTESVYADAEPYSSSNEMSSLPEDPHENTEETSNNSIIIGRTRSEYSQFLGEGTDDML